MDRSFSPNQQPDLAADNCEEKTNSCEQLPNKPKRRQKADPPYSPNSVGWTEAKTAQLFDLENPLQLVSGELLTPIIVEYETYGTLSPNRDNAILITHALSGDAHVAGWDKNAESSGRLWRKRYPGWWDSCVGPGKPLDTERFFLICSNVIGGCYGSTGPMSVNPKTGKPYGMKFPVITVSDWVNVQAKLLDYLGIERLKAVVGGSLGGQQALEWALAYPERIESAVILAASHRLSAQGLGFNAVGRHCIMNDPNFAGGDYYATQAPGNGLAAARMLAHITYLSEESMHEKFGRRFQGKDKPDFGFGVEFEVESYLAYQGQAFVERFDANSYLYITRAMDYYDAAAIWGNKDLSEAVRRIQSKILVVSFSSDWLYPSAQCRELALAMCRQGKMVTYVDIPSCYGHDAFLVETKPVGRLLTGFLNS